MLRGPESQGWGIQAVLTVLHLEGWVGHAEGGCSQRGASQPGGRRAAERGAWLKGRVRQSFQRG